MQSSSGVGWCVGEGLLSGGGWLGQEGQPPGETQTPLALLCVARVQRAHRAHSNSYSYVTRECLEEWPVIV